MKKLFLDIETLPSDEAQIGLVKDFYQKYLEKKKESPGKILSFEEYHRLTSLNGGLGRILCIGVALDEGPVEIISGEEKEILQKFWGKVEQTTLFIGHNILEFDLLFIWQRSIVLGVKPSIGINFRRYTTEQVFDTFQLWSQWSKTHETGSLDRLAKILGIPSPKGELDGSKVYDYFKAGKLQEIFEYCKKDVEVVRAIYKKLTFS